MSGWLLQCAILLCATYKAHQQSPPMISKNYCVDIGDTANLNCTTHYAVNRPPIWIRDNPPTQISSGNNLLVEHDRVSIQYDEGNSTSILVIKNISETDAGVYKCQVLSFKYSKDFTAFTRLKICNKPPIISDNSTRSVSVREDKPVDLKCYAAGYPPPAISWTRENNGVLPNGDFVYGGNILNIPRVRKEHRGTYSCNASNTVGYDTRNIQVQVEFAPVIISDNSTRSVSVPEDEPVDLKCYAAGYPPPAISWTRENNDVLPNGDFVYGGNILNIPRVRKEHRGTYSCIALNTVGYDTRNIQVRVEFAPVITIPCFRTGQALHYDVDVECHIYGYPLPEITWSKHNVILSTNQEYTIRSNETGRGLTISTLHVKGIQKHQYGMYLCKAVNKLGTARGALHLFETSKSMCPPACEQYPDNGALSKKISPTTVFCVLLFLYLTVA